jgi:hypothetical protein
LKNLWQKPYAGDNKNKQTTNDSLVVGKNKNKNGKIECMCNLNHHLHVTT